MLGQALVAADDRGRQPALHSLHGYFLLPATRREIVYDVERMRDGGSFTTRRVRGIQHGRPMFS